MERDDVIRSLAPHRHALAALGVQELCLFGSIARGEATPTSDVDLTLVLTAGPFWRRYNAVLDLLESILHRPVDLVPKADLKPALRERVEAESIRVA